MTIFDNKHMAIEIKTIGRREHQKKVEYNGKTENVKIEEEGKILIKFSAFRIRIASG